MGGAGRAVYDPAMMRALIVYTVLLLSGLLISACAAPSPPVVAASVMADDELRTVDDFDLERYLGTWYEIARYPNSFQKGVVAVTATYERREDGDIRVINAGRRGGLDGRPTESTARAWVPDAEKPAQLKVQFIWPLSADYWVIALGEDYEWAVVGQPSRKYLWVLAREPELPEDVYADILEQVEAQGYDPERLERTPQPDRSPEKRS